MSYRMGNEYTFEPILADRSVGPAGIRCCDTNQKQFRKIYNNIRETYDPTPGFSHQGATLPLGRMNTGGTAEPSAHTASISITRTSESDQ